MRPILSKGVVLVAVIVACGLGLASALAARSTFLAPGAGSPAVETSGGAISPVEIPAGINLDAGVDVAAYSGAIPADIGSILRSFP